MTPEEYLKFKQPDFIANCKDEGFAEVNAEEFFDLANMYIGKFKNVRNSMSLTDSIRDELVEKCEYHIWKDNTWESSKFSLITFWLTKAVWEDRTYYWARLRLGQYQNRKSGMALFDFTNDFLTETELYELLNAEGKNEVIHQKYIINSDDKMREIYSACHGAFECDYPIFRDAIETANFKNIVIKRQNFTQDLTYRLSGLMGRKWYGVVCENMDWKKSVCSGQGAKLEDDKQIKILNRVLPRP